MTAEGKHLVGSGVVVEVHAELSGDDAELVGWEHMIFRALQGSQHFVFELPSTEEGSIGRRGMSVGFGLGVLSDAVSAKVH